MEKNEKKRDRNHEFISIDGSYLEGGGQIIRNTTSLSAILKKPIKIVKIRANRKNPGLQAQHLTGFNLVAQIYDAKTTGAEIRSKEVTFAPGDYKAGEYEADIRTAGSCVLMLQISLPCLVFGSGETKVKFGGGTNAIMAPQIDYFTEIFGAIVQKFGIEFDCQLVRRGFYPKGGGIVDFKTSPVKELKPIQLLDQGEIVRIKIRSFCAGAVNENVAGRMTYAAKAILAKHFPVDKVEYIVKEKKEGTDTAYGDGAGIVIVAVTSTGCLLGGSALGDRSKRAETVGEEAANDLVKHFFHGGCLDEHAQDQVIIFMALAAGKSKVRVGPISMHTQTSIHYTQLMTGAQFTITKIPKTEHRWPGKEDSNWLECQGIGFKNQYLK